MIEKMKPEDRHAIRDKINEIIEVVNNPMYVLNMPKPLLEPNGVDNNGNPIIYKISGGMLPPKTGSELKESQQRPKPNHLEVNYIAVGYYKHEIDFGVLGLVRELSDDDFNKMLGMLNTAIGVAKDMRKETGKVAQKEDSTDVWTNLYEEKMAKIKSLEERLARVETELKEEKMCANAYIKDCEMLTNKLAKAEELYLKLSKVFGDLSNDLERAEEALKGRR